MALGRSELGFGRDDLLSLSDEIFVALGEGDAGSDDAVDSDFGVFVLTDDGLVFVGVDAFAGADYH